MAVRLQAATRGIEAVRKSRVAHALLAMHPPATALNALMVPAIREAIAAVGVVTGQETNAEGALIAAQHAADPLVAVVGRQAQTTGVLLRHNLTVVIGRGGKRT